MYTKKQDPKELTDSFIGNEIIFEDVHANEIHNDIAAIRTIINGRRDVGFIDLNKSMVEKIGKYNLGIIPVRMTSQNTIMSIIYREKSKLKAFRLYEIAKSKSGYLKDRTPEEAREIGQLLGYNEESINEYIQKHYKKKPHLRIDTPDDYNDLDEQNFPDFEKEITKDEITHTLNKRLLFIIKDVKIYAVNADFVRDKDPGLGFNGFTDGGSHYVTSLPGYKKIPENEIWIDDVFLSKPNDLGAFILHELLERHLMKFYGVPYDTAHTDYAEKAESMFREKSKEGLGIKIIKQIYHEFLEKYAEHHKIKKLNESFQFNKMFDLIKRII
jgi:hypothetical protein